MERLAGEDALTANQIESQFGYTGKERLFSLQKYLGYIEDATGVKGSQAAFMDPLANVGHYAVYPRVAGDGFGYVTSGEVLLNGNRHLYDDQIGKTMTWDEMI